MRKKNKKLAIIVSVILAVVILIGILVFVFKNYEFIRIRYYDENGTEIKQFFSTYAQSVYSMDLTVTATNTGSFALSCFPTLLSPLELDTAMADKSPRILPKNGKAEWTSNLIPLSLFASRQQPIIFNVSVICSYSDAQGVHYLPIKSGYESVYVTSSCGNAICETTENDITCPQDCFIGDKVKFRTTSLTYGSGSSIAFTSTCGNILDKYGYDTQGLKTATGVIDCTWESSSITYITVLSNLPGGWKAGFNAPKLLVSPTDPNRYKICQDQPGGKSIYYYYYVKNYGSPSVSNSPISIDGTKEFFCGGTSPPPTQTCGNNIKEGTELCDGTDLGTPPHTCVDEFFAGGTLGCLASCDEWYLDECIG